MNWGKSSAVEALDDILELNQIRTRQVMNVHQLPRPSVPDMQALDDEAGKHLDALHNFLETLELVHHVDKVFLTAARNNLLALDSTLKLAIRVDDPEDGWSEFER